MTENPNLGTSSKASSLADLGLCNCRGNCENRHCICRKADPPRKCDPSRCGCCTRSQYGVVCSNVESDDMPFYPHLSTPQIPPIDHPIRIEDNLIVASWNIQSFGGNFLTDGHVSLTFKKLESRIIEFIEHYRVDILFIQETINESALDHLCKAASAYFDSPYKSSCFRIGQGFNKSLRERCEEFAAVLYSERVNGGSHHPLHIEAINDCPLIREVPLQVRDGENDPEELVRSFRRVPAYFTIQTAGGKTFSFISVHLSSDNGLGIVRLTTEIESLLEVRKQVQQKSSLGLTSRLTLHYPSTNFLLT